MRIGFIGMGRMGRGMATNLLRAGHDLTVYNRTREKVEALERGGARVARSPRSAAEGAEAVITMLADDAAVDDVVLGPEGVIRGLPVGAVHVSMSTISPAMSKRLARAHESERQRYVAAPVLGRPETAEEGSLVIVAGGPWEAIEACNPLFAAIGKETHVLGEAPEKANAVKLGMNLAFAMLIETLGEAYALVESFGIDDCTFLHILNGSVLRSPVVEGYGRLIARGEFDPPGFRLKLGEKDLRLAVEAGESAGVAMPLARALRQLFVAAIGSGKGDLDWAAIARASTGKAA